MKKEFFAFLLLGMSCAGASSAHAQRSHHAVLMHFEKAIHIPGQTLEPGTYLFVPSDSGNAFVQVFDASRSRLLATVSSIPCTRLDITNDYGIKTATGRDSMRSLRSWFAPGESTGYELLYGHEPNADPAH